MSGDKKREAVVAENTFIELLRSWREWLYGLRLFCEWQMLEVVVELQLSHGPLQQHN